MVVVALRALPGAAEGVAGDVLLLRLHHSPLKMVPWELMLRKAALPPTARTAS